MPKGSLSPCLRKFLLQGRKALLWDMPSVGLQGTFGNGCLSYSVVASLLTYLRHLMRVPQLSSHCWSNALARHSHGFLLSSSSKKTGCFQMSTSSGVLTKDSGKYTFFADVSGTMGMFCLTGVRSRNPQPEDQHAHLHKSHY